MLTGETTPLRARSLMLHERARTATYHSRTLLARHTETARATKLSIANVRTSREARDTQREQPTGVRRRMGKPRVLFLEDDVDSRSAHALAMRNADLDVEGVGSVKEAHDAIATALPDVVVADRSLPDGDGFKDFVAVMRRDPRSSNIPCIALTGATSAKDIEAAVLSGCDVYLVKPVDPDLVVLRVREQCTAAVTPRRGSV